MSYLGVKRAEEFNMTVSAVVHGQKIEWTDKKRYLWLVGAILSAFLAWRWK